MTSELRQIIEHSRFHRAAVEQVAMLLPADDATLDGWFAERVAALDQKGFMFLTVAAMTRDRLMDARHLVRGAMLLSDSQSLGCVSLRATGDVAENLMAALRHSHLIQECEASAMFTIAVWCRDHRDRKFPAELIPRARARARSRDLRAETEAFLIALAVETGDTGLMTLIKQHYPKATPENWQAVEESARKVGHEFLARCRQPVVELLNEKPEARLAHGNTMRRAVARVGRNEPCPCGSGKKYKHCCVEKDHERLHHSSDVAGLTREELSVEPELHLNSSRLERSAIYDLALYDPRKIPPELLAEYFLRLCAFRLFDRAVEAMQWLGYSEARKADWEHIVLFAARARRRDVIRRLVDLRPDPAEVEETIQLGPMLLLAEDDPAATVALLEECADDALQKGGADALRSLAYGLLFSRFRALGIFVARSTIPLLPEEDAAGVFKRILEIRDQLNLPPDDSFGEVLDRQFAKSEADNGHDSEELQKALDSLNAKAEEVRQLKESLARVQREITLREKRAKAESPAAPTPPADERALRELRERLETMKSALKERHGERNELRRELHQAHEDLASLRQNAAATPPASDNAGQADNEDDLLLPPDTADSQPIRVIEFPRNFQQTLAAVPRHVARGALSMLGRLAGGEPAAFVGAVRLKACPSITRQRIGIDHRLLFRLLPDRVQVVDLIPRQDLERRIKTLA